VILKPQLVHHKECRPAQLNSGWQPELQIQGKNSTTRSDV
jgi:hypothetical protein